MADFNRIIRRTVPANRVQQEQYFKLEKLQEETNVHLQQLGTRHIPKLPDEIIAHVLASPAIDLATLTQALRVSKRIYQIAMYILVHHRLPLLQMGLFIDQEGKNRISYLLQFSRFEHLSKNAIFGIVGAIPRRYYTHKATPLIRFMSMTDHFYNSNRRDAASIKNYKIKALEGFHFLSATYLLPRKKSKKRSWSLTYQISNKDKYSFEYYFTPHELSISLDHLVHLEAYYSFKSSSTNSSCWGDKLYKWINTIVNKVLFK